MQKCVQSIYTTYNIYIKHKKWQVSRKLSIQMWASRKCEEVIKIKFLFSNRSKRLQLVPPAESLFVKRQVHTTQTEKTTSLHV